MQVAVGVLGRCKFGQVLTSRKITSSCLQRRNTMRSAWRQLEAFIVEWHSLPPSNWRKINLRRKRWNNTVSYHTVLRHQRVLLWYMISWTNWYFTTLSRDLYMGPKKTLTRTSRRQGTLWIVLMPMLLGQKTCDLCYVGLVRCRLPSHSWWDLTVWVRNDSKQFDCIFQCY